MHSPLRYALIIFAAISFAGGDASAASMRGTSIVDTPHNLSVSGGKGVSGIKSAKEERVCIFCHTPHHSSWEMPLWSRDMSASVYVPYDSSTMMAEPNQPNGSSRLCLSCHDGTIALGLLKNKFPLDDTSATMKSFNDMAALLVTDPGYNPNLGIDLSDDHPISIFYPEGKQELESIANIKAQGIKLEWFDMLLECTSCHNPHNNQNGKFLVVNQDVQRDALCTVCHIRTGWQAGQDLDTAHKTGGSRYGAALADEVSKNGCTSCHRMHTAPGPVSLLTGVTEEATCLAACHQNAPYTNIQSQFLRPYRHPVADQNQVHEAAEDLPVNDAPASKHVECVDCHNPHRAGWQDAPLDSLQLPQPVVKPLISGPLRGVRVVGKAEADYEYEVCFKCHAGAYAEGFAQQGAGFPSRLFQTHNEQNRFQPGNASVHPVMTDRPVSSTGRSLRFDYQANMKRIYCADCHEPHGADYDHLLKAAYPDAFPGTDTNFSDWLCFRCHDQTYLLGAGSTADTAPLHRKHVLPVYTTPGADANKRVPCAACHDPHGVPTSNADWQHLINFDVRWAGGAPLYTPAAPRSCTVDCHTVAAKYQTY